MKQLRVGSALCWSAAWLAACSTPTLYVTGVDLPWWIAAVTFAPLVALIVWRSEKTGSYSDSSGDGPHWAP